MPTNNYLRVWPTTALKIWNGTLGLGHAELRNVRNKHCWWKPDSAPVCVFSNVDTKVNWTQFLTAVGLTGSPPYFYLYIQATQGHGETGLSLLLHSLTPPSPIPFLHPRELEGRNRTHPWNWLTNAYGYKTLHLISGGEFLTSQMTRQTNIIWHWS